MEQGVDGCAKKIHNLIKGVKRLVAKGVSQIVPDVLHRVKFRAVRQQGDEDHVFRNAESMGPRAIQRRQKTTRKWTSLRSQPTA